MGEDRSELADRVQSTMSASWETPDVSRAVSAAYAARVKAFERRSYTRMLRGVHYHHRHYCGRND